MSDASRWLDEMQREWPQSWAGLEEDVPIGERLVEVFRPFVEHLAAKGLSQRTIKHKVDDLWLLGGEIIHRLDVLDRDRRDLPGRELVLHYISPYEGPISRHLSESEQEVFDRTCRQLYKFLA